MSEISASADFNAYASFLKKDFEINLFSDGRRKYTNVFIDKIDEAAIRFSSQTSQMPKIKDLVDKIGQGLSESTDNFSREGNLKIEGPLAHHFIDNLLFSAAKKETGTHESLKIVAEIIIATAIKKSRFSLDYSEYQTDISILGSEPFDAAFSMEIIFRPIPKNIEPTEAG